MFDSNLDFCVRKVTFWLILPKKQQQQKNTIGTIGDLLRFYSLRVLSFPTLKYDKMSHLNNAHFFFIQREPSKH